jgi:GNAT superfamily N-acetyltransferase
VEIRLMCPDDLPVAERLSAAAFGEVDALATPRGWPVPPPRTAARSEGWIRRTRPLLETDPGGCWAAVDDSGLLGFTVSVRRERLWVLVTFAVRPGVRGRGIGRQLLQRAETHAYGCDRGILSASDDDRALRLYHVAGFALHPQMMFGGEVDKSIIPAVGLMRDGTPDDQEWMDDLDRDLRGAPHGPDHALLAGMASRLVVTAERTGYAYTSPAGTFVVAARDTGTASRLLWQCLADADEEFEIGHVTSANMWAADIALRARLKMRTEGFLAVRGMAPPAPYIHNGPLLLPADGPGSPDGRVDGASRPRKPPGPRCDPQKPVRSAYHFPPTSRQG